MILKTLRHGFNLECSVDGVDFQFMDKRTFLKEMIEKIPEAMLDDQFEEFMYCFEPKGEIVGVRDGYPVRETTLEL
jgi:hypothetical protein